MANIANTMKTITARIDPILSGLPVVDASVVKNKFGEVTKMVAKGAIAISRYSRPELVIITAAEYVRLETARRAPLDHLTGQFDELVAKMQTAPAQKAVHALFGASSAELGRAAVKTAQSSAS